MKRPLCNPANDSIIVDAASHIDFAIQTFRRANRRNRALCSRLRVWIPRVTTCVLEIFFLYSYYSGIKRQPCDHAQNTDRYEGYYILSDYFSAKYIKKYGLNTFVFFFRALSRHRGMFHLFNKCFVDKMSHSFNFFYLCV